MPPRTNNAHTPPAIQAWIPENLSIESFKPPPATDEEIDWVMGVHNWTDVSNEVLVEARAQFRAKMERRLGPGGEIPVLGRKPGPNANEPVLKTLSIPDSGGLSVRLFRGGFPIRGAGMGLGLPRGLGGMLFFDFVDEHGLPVDMPDGYSVHQLMGFGSKIALQPMHNVLGIDTQGTNLQCFAIMENVSCVLQRPGRQDWQFSTVVQY
ncbi:hypothetical protein DFH06DRAFT_705823 [Mycena polygramma]|nr:hypothetical protein DFH06DRAFT_705823 [Mycena polygramma]